MTIRRAGCARAAALILGGNYGIANTLRGAREDERRALEAK
jgi:hypothetical protein